MAPSTNYLGALGDGQIEIPETSSSVVGIVVAICGNILISLALNFQKLAHKRLDREHALAARAAELETRRNSAIDADGDPQLSPVSSSSQHSGSTIRNGRPSVQTSSTTSEGQVVETVPLLQHSYSDPSPSYGARTSPSVGISVIHSDITRPLPSPSSIRPPSSPPQKNKFLSRILPFTARPKRRNSPALSNVREEASEATHPLLPVDGLVDSPIDGHIKNGPNGKGKEDKDLSVEHRNESDYLKSKLWWFGFLLMNIGECGNFISYAFAPASVVAPLGTFALMANCLFAPLMLKERFRKRDLLGILIAIVGAVTVVVASNTSDVRLNPAGLIHAISQRPFVIFSCVYIVAAIVLATLSEGQYGRKFVIVDVGLCAIFGGFTVLSTKGISTILTMEWIDMFTEWITYPVILVLVATGVGQIRYLNRALKRFDSKVVIPIQFVLFTLSAIIGSAILYGDFKKAKLHQMLTFLYGCAATFLGVFIIAWSPSTDHSNIDDVEDGRVEIGEDERAGVERALNAGVVEGSSGAGDVRSLGRRTPLRPGAPGTPLLRHKSSSVSLIGLSPAQHLLLVHTPPRDRPEYWDRDVEPAPTPASSHRRRAISWFGEERPRAVVFDRGHETDDE